MKVLVGLCTIFPLLKMGPRRGILISTCKLVKKTVVQAICFSPKERKYIEEAMEKCSPIKMQKFVHDKKEGSTDILMSDNVVIDKVECEDLTFLREELVPANLNISMLSMISLNQLLTIKGKLVHLQELQEVNVQGRVLKKVDGVFIDPHGSIKVTLWEGDIEKVEEGGTYEFKNLRLKNDDC